MKKEELRLKHKNIVDLVNENISTFEYFSKNVINFFEQKKLSGIVHSVKHRIKDIDHILEKIERKNAEITRRGERNLINEENLFSRITDIAGVRVLHIHLSQFEKIHSAIMEKIDEEEFILAESPKAYTWDPDSSIYFEKLNIEQKIKDSFYTSIHYVLRPNRKSPATCEVQVRTLLEEVWGEVDHAMNYPSPIQDTQCREQLRVLARLIGAGSHLADSIMRHYVS